MAVHQCNTVKERDRFDTGRTLAFPSSEFAKQRL